MITFGFLIATSRNMPFKDDVSNKFKLATECCLMITLIFAIMLKVDLRKEAVTADHIGFILLLNNTIVPGATLVLSYLMAVKAASSIDKEMLTRQMYSGTYDKETGELTYFEEKEGDGKDGGRPLTHPDFNPAADEDEDSGDKGYMYAMENPMLQSDMADEDEEDEDDTVDTLEVEAVDEAADEVDEFMMR